MSPDVSRDRGLAPSLTGLNLQLRVQCRSAGVARGTIDLQRLRRVAAGGVARRGAPTKVCKGATLACSGAESAASGHTGDWLVHARPFAHSGDVVTIFAEALHYLVDRVSTLLRAITLSRLILGPSMLDDCRRERSATRSTLPPYFAAKAAGEGISVARKSAW